MIKDILALDLGSTMGAATYNGERWVTKSFTFTGKRPEKLSKLLLWLVHLQRRDLIVYERPFCRGLHATRMLWGMAGIIEAWAEDNEIPVVDQVPSAIKKWATGNGRASKQDMIDVAAIWGHPDLNDHEADALLLGLYTLKHMEITT